MDTRFTFSFDDVKGIVNNTSIPRPITRENVSDFFTRNKSNYDKCVFCYNYVPRSLAFDMDKAIKYLDFISNNKKTLLVLANHDDTLCLKENVVSCDNDFSIKKVMSCENLLDIWNVANCCDEIIVFPTGSSWLFFHNLTDLKDKKMYLLGNREVYSKT